MKALALKSTALFLIISSSSIAQSAFGLKGGVNISKLKMNTDQMWLKSTYKTGFNIGGFAELKLSEKLYLQPEILLNAAGGKWGEGNGGDNVIFTCNYISIPLLLKYKIKNISFGAGPQAGLLMSASSKMLDEKSDEKDFFESYDFGGILNIDYDLTQKLNVGLRYQAGLVNVVKDNNDFKTINKSFQLSLQYKLK